MKNNTPNKKFEEYKTLKLSDIKKKPSECSCITVDYHLATCPQMTTNTPIKQEKRVKYQVTKKQCQARIKGVCEGCGGQLEPIKTVDNSGNPTYWVGCQHCSCFRGGIDRRYWEIARGLVEKNEMIPYRHMSRHEYEDTPDRLEYWFDIQCAGLSRDIAFLHNLLLEKFKEEQAQ